MISENSDKAKKEKRKWFAIDGKQIPENMKLSKKIIKINEKLMMLSQKKSFGNFFSDEQIPK